MRATGLLVGASLLACAALALVVSGWRQPRPGVAAAIGHLRRTATPPVHASLARQPLAGPGVFDRLGTMLTGSGSALGRSALGWAQALRLIGRSVERHVGILVVGAVVGFFVPSLVLGVLHLTGVVSLRWWVPGGVSLLVALVVPAVLHSDAMSTSAEVAVDVRHQLGAYLDMVTMLLAGNSGYEGALDQAARAGDGMLFRELRRRMREVATTGHSLIGALELVAADYGIVELEQVAATARVSAAEGAPVARSLNAKCATLRSTLAAEQEATARVRIDQITPPLVGMALLFMALIIYPALNLN